MVERRGGPRRRGLGTWRVFAAIAGMMALGSVTGCAGRAGESRFTGEPFLLVWAGDADRTNADFLALLDADARSPSYGKVLRTYPVRSRGNEPQELNAAPRDDRRVFASGVLTNRVFVFDVRQPLAARLIHVDEAGPERGLWAPHDLVSLPNGHVVVACADRAHYRNEPEEVLGAPGGLLELGADGQFVREVSAAGPDARSLIVAPFGVTVAGRRLVTTNRGHGFTASTRGPAMPGISVQLWRLDDLQLERTAVLAAGPRGEENLGPASVRAFHHHPVVFVATHEGGALYASDSIGQPDPAFRLVRDFGAGALLGNAAVTPDDRFYVLAMTGRNRVVSFDVSDPWRPKAIAALRFDLDPTGSGRARVGGPSGLTMSADGTRVAVANYTVDVPGYRLDGDHRVNLLRLDPATGQLRFDDAFRDEVTGEVGVDFNRTTWPHGQTGPARPRGLLFVTAEPPPDQRRQ